MFPWAEYYLRLLENRDRDRKATSFSVMNLNIDHGWSGVLLYVVSGISSKFKSLNKNHFELLIVWILTIWSSVSWNPQNENSEFHFVFIFEGQGFRSFFSRLMMSVNQIISSFRSMFFPRQTLVTWSIGKEVNQTKEYVTMSKMAVANLIVPSTTWLFLQWRHIKNQVYLSRLQVRPNQTL